MQFVECQGARIPAIGLGTMTLKEDVCVEAVKTALQLGYRSLDTAEKYGNEIWVGEGLAESGVKREDVFLTTKVDLRNLASPDFERSVDESLEKLQVSSVDLLLIHWNNPDVPFTDSIGSLCKVKRAGLTKHIGVANFTTSMLNEAVKYATEPLVANQIEVHPFLDQTKVLTKCRELDISVTAYCPAARGRVPGDETLGRKGRAHGKTATQVALRWLVQQRVIPIPRSASPEHLKANLDIFDFELTDAEMADITALKRADGRVVSPPFAPQWDT